MHSIYLLRHCAYDNPRNILPGRLPLELSAEGTAHAKRLGEYFADKKISTIYSSAVMRVKQTSEHVSAGTIPIIYDQRLLETLSAYQGYWEENWHGDGFHFFSHRDDVGGENLADIQVRMANFWDEITNNLTENIIICSHGDPLQTLYNYIHDLPLTADNAREDETPGWLEKGEFWEIRWDAGKRVETKKKTGI